MTDPLAFRLRRDAQEIMSKMSSLKWKRGYMLAIALTFLAIVIGLGWKSRVAVELLGLGPYLAILIVAGIVAAYTATKSERAGDWLRDLEREVDRDLEELANLLGRTSDAVLAMDAERLRYLADEVMRTRIQNLNQWTREFKDYFDPKLSAYAMNNLTEIIEDRQELLTNQVREAAEVFQKFNLTDY